MSRAWDVSDDRRPWEALLDELGDVDGVYVSVGVHSEDAERPGAGEEPNLAFIAGVHEFGSSDGRIPQRSFLRSTFDEEAETSWARLLRQAADLALTQPGTGNAQTRLQQLALLMQSDVQEKIRDRIPPPLSERTQQDPRRAGDDITPLIDNGFLINAILARISTHRGGE